MDDEMRKGADETSAGNRRSSGMGRIFEGGNVALVSGICKNDRILAKHEALLQT